MSERPHSKPPSKEERLAAQLRANLRRRKGNPGKGSAQDGATSQGARDLPKDGEAR